MLNISFPDRYSFDQLFTFSGLSGKTDYSSMLTLLSRKERFTYWPMLPERSGEIRIPDYDGEITVCSDFALFGPTRMLLADAWNLLIDGPVTISDMENGAYETAAENGKTLFATRGFLHKEFLTADFDAILKERQDAFECMRQFPEIQDKETAQAAVRACSVLRSCVYSPEEKFTTHWVTPDRWPHRACWIMDSVYQALGLQYFDQQAAEDAILALFAHQEPSGKVPMVASPEYMVDWMIQQPVIANGLKAINPSSKAIKYALPRLAAFAEWVIDHRDLDGDGILEWLTNPQDKVCPCGESGMDNSPRFDGAPILGAVDLTCFVSRECEVIAEFAGMLGQHELQARFEEHHRRMNAKIEEKLWDDDMGFYCDYDIFRRKTTKVMAVSGFMPLYCGAASKEHAARLAELVRSPEHFGTYYPLPTVSVSDPKFELDMWRGPVWHIFNYHTAEGLERYGFQEEADNIRRKTVEAGVRYYREFGAFYEFYDPFGKTAPGYINRKGKNCPDADKGDWVHRAVHDYGWSASVFMHMLFQTLSNKGEK